LVLFMLVFAAFVFFAPNALGHPDNYIPANPMVTPEHIVPEWYLLPFYAILRSITFDIWFLSAKLLGVIAMVASIVVLFIMPWLDTSKVKSLRYRPMMRPFFFLFILVCIGLGWVGAETPDKVLFALGDFQYQMVHLGLTLTAAYFAYFLVILPLVGILEKPSPMPASIEESVLKGRKPAQAA